MIIAHSFAPWWWFICCLPCVMLFTWIRCRTRRHSSLAGRIFLLEDIVWLLLSLSLVTRQHTSLTICSTVCGAKWQVLFPSTEPPTLLDSFDFTNLTLPRNFLTNKSIWSRILMSHDTYRINVYYSSGTTKWPDTCGSLKFRQPICWARCSCIFI